MPPKRPEYQEEARRRMKRGLLPEAVEARERALAARGEDEEDEEAEAEEEEEKPDREPVDYELDALAALAQGASVSQGSDTDATPAAPISLKVGGNDGADA